VLKERLRELVQHNGYELLLVLLLAASMAFSASLSPYFLTVTTLFDMTSQFMEIGLMALAMTLVIILGQIDLSVASILALVGVVFGLMNERGISLGVAIPAVLALATVLGLINGWLAVLFRLPALVVTLGTMALYRGVGQILLGDRLPTGFRPGLSVSTFATSPVPQCRCRWSSLRHSRSSSTSCCTGQRLGGWCTRWATTRRRAASPASPWIGCR